MGYRSGFKAKMYMGTTLVKGVLDITLPFSRNEIQVKSRESVWVKYLKGLIDVPIDFTIHYDPADASFQALQAAFLSDADDSYVNIEFTDNVKTAATWRGIKADWEVTKFEKADPMEDVSDYNVSIRLSAAAGTEPTVTQNESSD
ncbi:MAG: hypothetical protein LBT05_08425 [Planctomycetaceae bacterium]|jgi:hypothetical protein|nr:hypothetical protein [Planctomycetaceae bacterium]